MPLHAPPSSTYLAQVLGADRAALSQQLSDARSRLQSGEAAWSNAAAELAGAQGLSGRVEELTSQLREATAKVCMCGHMCDLCEAGCFSHVWAHVYLV